MKSTTDLSGWCLACGLAVLLGLPGAAETVPETLVTAHAETEGTKGDADDPAIWADPVRPLVIGTDKQKGLRVYDLNGALLQEVQDGALNNVDLRAFDGLGGVALVGATKRETDSLVFYSLGADGRLVATAPALFPATFPGVVVDGTLVDDVYGFAMGLDTDGPLAIANFKTGQIYVWRVAVTGGQLALQPLRVHQVPSQPEGMVFDDVTGQLYVGEEDGGVWRFAPDGAATLVARVGDPCLPRDDVEGMAIHNGAPRHLVVSAQGIDRAAIYEITADGLVCKGLVGVAAGAIDGVTETDGLDVTSVTLPGYEAGLLVMMDDQNEGFTSNFKLMSWAEIAVGLGL
jgi:3-phytase